MRLRFATVALSLPVLACTTGPHASNREIIGQDECVTCHVDDYERTGDLTMPAICSATRPDHPALGIDQTCANCHTEFSWCPALEVGDHPENCFPLRGAHDMACRNCHDSALGASANGANTTCTQSGCHSYRGNRGRHHEVSGYEPAYQLAVDNGRMNLCLSCHWTGRKHAFTREVRLDGSPNCP